jgi:maleamate amidohydrolase
MSDRRPSQPGARRRSEPSQAGPPVGEPAHVWDDLIGDEERRMLAELRGAHDVGSRPALLMVDLFSQAFGPRPEQLEDGVAQPSLACGAAAWAALPTLELVLDEARRHGVPVVHSTGESRVEARPGATTLLRRTESEELASRYAIVEAVAPVAGEHVVYKSGASAFFGTALATILRRLDVDTLVVAGETTSGCVRASVVDAYSYGFDVVLAEDAIFDRSELSHKVNLFDMHLKYATAVPVSRAVRYLATTDPAAMSQDS